MHDSRPNPPALLKRLADCAYRNLWGNRKVVWRLGRATSLATRLGQGCGIARPNPIPCPGDIARFMAHVEKPLRTVTLGDVQAFADSLSALAPATTGRYLHARPTESSSKFMAV